MIRAITAFAVAICVVFSMTDGAAAKTHRHHRTIEKAYIFKANTHRHHRKPVYAPVVFQIADRCDDRYCNYGPVATAQAKQQQRQSIKYSGSYGSEHVIGGRPSGCPHAFCGCEASLYKFGRIIPYLNLAVNWIHRYPRAAPAPGMAAARSGHVMILMSHVDGSNWLVHDGNSGHHLTREHVRSIAGYVIVNPDIQLASR